MTSPKDFPEDENGDVLRRMEEDGNNLELARDIEFTVVFPSEGDAKAFSQHFRKIGYVADAKLSECVPDLPWDVVVVKNMIPTHAGITSFENDLVQKASEVGGRNDGWGCFGM